MRFVTACPGTNRRLTSLPSPAVRQSAWHQLSGYPSRFFVSVDTEHSSGSTLFSTQCLPNDAALPPPLQPSTRRPRVPWLVPLGVPSARHRSLEPEHSGARLCRRTVTPRAACPSCSASLSRLAFHLRSTNLAGLDVVRSNRSAWAHARAGGPSLRVQHALRAQPRSPVSRSSVASVFAATRHRSLKQEPFVSSHCRA